LAESFPEPLSALSASPKITRTVIQERLQGFTATTQSVGIRAAVAVLVTEAGYGPNLSGLSNTSQWRSDGALLLTKRAAHLKRHAHQWALPGGRVEKQESLIQAAMRETREEIQFELNADDYLGRLDDYVTRSGFTMSALVFWVGKAESALASPDEVESIHRIPFSELLREDAPILSYDELNDSEELKASEPDDSFGQRPNEQKSTQRAASTVDSSPVLRMPIGDDWIAAPTAAVLYQFREVCLLGRQTRVAHFEQPRFAWK